MFSHSRRSALAWPSVFLMLDDLTGRRRPHNFSHVIAVPSGSSCTLFTDVKAKQSRWMSLGSGMCLGVGLGMGLGLSLGLSLGMGSGVGSGVGA